MVAAGRAKSNFLSSMSHEMRTPLNAIIGMTTIAKKSTDTNEIKTALNKISSASSHLLGLISNILDMAKIEADKMELVHAECNLENMIANVLSMFTFKIDEKNQTLTVHTDENIPRTIVSDEILLSKVLSNLLSNAIKFTPPKGNIGLRVSVSEQTDTVCVLQIEVTDDGIGMSPEQQRVMFDAFVQAESGKNREHEGTGLGLAISKRIIDLMDGKITVESERGKGTRVTLTIKTGIKPKDKKNAEAYNYADNIGDFTIDGMLEGKKLLVVEDIEINREIITLLLEGSGLAIDCAGNGKEALDIITAEPDKYDIIFMDMQMPVMNGLEATRAIRALPPRKSGRLPIVAMTANAFREDIKNCIDAGMDAHLVKPLDINKVYAALCTYLKV
jgi:CheY-like chemotaxis protein